MSRPQAIAQYGLATAGVAVAVGLVAGRTTAPAAAIVLMGLVPFAAVFGATMMAVEAQRVARAGCFLRHLERLLNAKYPDGSGPLTWETDIAKSSLRVHGYVLSTAAVLGAYVAIGPGLGGYFLLHRHLVVAFWFGVTVDLVILVALSFWVRLVSRRIRSWTTGDWPSHGDDTA